MAKPSCPKCKGTRFELTPLDIKTAKQQHLATICSSCGTIVGLEESLSAVYILCMIAEKLGVDID